MENKNKNIFEIYSVKKYKVDNASIKVGSGDIYKICNKLSNDKSYHLNLLNDTDYILYGDVDHIANEELFEQILEALSDYFNIDKDDISYTKAIKENEFSYHWSFNAYIATLKQLKLYMKEFKNKHPKFKDYIDLSVYSNNRWFRLPNQTNEDKPIAHKVIKGNMSDFIFNYMNGDVERLPIICEKEKEKVKPTNNEFNEDKTKYDYIEKIVDLIDDDLAEEYDDWTKIGFAIHNELGDEGLPIFQAFSKRSNKYDATKDDKWFLNLPVKKDGYNLGTLIKSISDDNKEEYIELKKEYLKLKEEKVVNESINPELEKTFSLLEGDIAPYIIKKYLTNTEGDINYVCVSCSELKFFYFAKNRWVEDVENATIFRYITKHFVKEIEEYIKNNDDNKMASKLLSKIKGKLSNYRGILEWIANELLNPKFYDLCDNNIYLLGFNNGVYDTKTKIFRDGKPSDYITKTTGYDFSTDDKGYSKDINEFLKKVFPEEDVREYIIQQQAQSISGMKGQDCIYTHTGRGGNGKSIEQGILKNVFGDYFLEIPSSMLTKINKMEHNKPDPFYSELKGVRYSVANEPSDGSKINDSLLKIMASKEGMKYRTLFSNKVEKLALQTQIHIYCNNKLEFNGDDGGLCRRFKVINYISKFTSDKDKINEDNNIYEMDVELSEKVMLWREDYMRMLISKFDPKYKYNEPQSIKNNSEKYSDANNDIKRFVEDHFEFTNKREDYLLMKNIKLMYNKDYDQTKLKNLKEHLEKEMNVNVMEKSKVKKNDKWTDVRSVIFGWKMKVDENITDSEEEP